MKSEIVDKFLAGIVEKFRNRKRRYIYRDAETGEFVSREYAAANPSTTVREEIL